MKYRVFCIAVLVFLIGCAGVPLTDSPFQKITRAAPKKNYLVAVQARVVPSFSHVFSPLGPVDADVRVAACAGLSNTRFRCARMDGNGEPLEKPDYVVQIEYDVVDERHFTGSRFFGGALLASNREYDNDDPGDAAHEVRWGFRVLKPGEAKPVFQSVFHQDSLQFWHFDVEQWMERYFSG